MQSRSNAALLFKRTKLKREEVSGARRSKYRCGPLGPPKRPRGQAVRGRSVTGNTRRDDCGKESELSSYEDGRTGRGWFLVILDAL